MEKELNIEEFVQALGTSFLVKDRIRRVEFNPIGDTFSHMQECLSVPISKELSSARYVSRERHDTKIDIMSFPPFYLRYSYCEKCNIFFYEF